MKTRPGKILCIGRNYREHAAELGNAVPERPIFFLKPPSALIGSGESIVRPSQSVLVHHEGELGLVVGRTARHVSVESALDFIEGYTLVNDVTARDLQRADGHFTRAKGFDTFCPVGPEVVPGLPDLACRVQCAVDGEVRQDAPLSAMVFGFAELVAYLSAHMTLEPGDLIATGTPSGVGPLVEGNVVEVRLAEPDGRVRLVLSNPVVDFTA